MYTHSLHVCVCLCLCLSVYECVRPTLCTHTRIYALPLLPKIRVGKASVSSLSLSLSLSLFLSLSLSISFKTVPKHPPIHFLRSNSRGQYPSARSSEILKKVSVLPNILLKSTRYGQTQNHHPYFQPVSPALHRVVPAPLETVCMYADVCKGA